jgi:hypothetical protein
MRGKTIDIVTLWSRFGIGMPDDTAVLERVLKKLRDIPLYEVGIMHNEESLIRFKEMMLKNI